ncbi:MAG TPA: hypothetical protein VIB82_10255 [Caulobacteraceae bacterium]|jgi:hypothetical protein
MPFPRYFPLGDGPRGPFPNEVREVSLTSILAPALASAILADLDRLRGLYEIPSPQDAGEGQGEGPRPTG